MHTHVRTFARTHPRMHMSTTVARSGASRASPADWAKTSPEKNETQIVRCQVRALKARVQSPVPAALSSSLCVDTYLMLSRRLRIMMGNAVR